MHLHTTYNLGGRGAVIESLPICMPRGYRNLVSVMVCPFVMSAVGLSGVPGVARSASVLALVLIALLLIGGTKGWLTCPRYIWLPIPFVAFSALSLLWGETEQAVELPPLFTVWAGSFAVAVALSNRMGWRSLEYGLILAVGANLIAWHFGVDMHEVLHDWASVDYLDDGRVVIRSTGLIGNANEYALGMIGPALLVWAHPEAFSRMSRWMLSGVALFAAQRSGSRLGLILLCGLLVLIAVRIVRHRNGRLAILSLLAVVGYFAFVWDDRLTLADGFTPLYRLLEALTGRESSFSTRADLIWVGWSLFLQSPVMGHGYASFARVSNSGLYAHNNWIELAVNGGMVGLALYYGVHVSILRAARRLRGDKCLAVSLLIFLLAGADCAMVSYTSRMVVLTLATLCVLAFPASPRRGGQQPSYRNAAKPMRAARRASARTSMACSANNEMILGDIRFVVPNPQDRVNSSPPASAGAALLGKTRRLRHEGGRMRKLPQYGQTHRPDRR
jgi:O-antigen ligase